MMGMARDGGLLLPESIPDVSDSLSAWRGLAYNDLAFEIMKIFVDLPAPDLKRLVTGSYSCFDHPEVTPAVSKEGIHILELFHGPTLAFKDVALQFLGNMFEYIMRTGTRRLNILAATSGDTGSAAIYGVRGRERIRIFVMHPRGKVSEIQERQMTSVLADNVFNIAVEGTFDDCQNIMKTVFNDLEFRDSHCLGSVNSINWARLLAQIVYYFYGAFRVMETTGARKVSFSVPTGNFGDIFAGYLACRMGLPVHRLVLATNENDILSRFFNTGVYSRGQVHATISPSMDIQVASNFERYLFHKVGEDSSRLRCLMKQLADSGQLSVDVAPDGRVDELFCAGSGNTEQTLATIRNFHEDAQYLLDPHSAVGVFVGQQQKTAGVPMICLATAHPAKFGKAIRTAIGSDVARHAIIDELKSKETRLDILPASVDSVKEYIEQKITKG